MLAATTLSATDQETRKGKVTGTRIVKLVDGRALEVFNDMMGYAEPVKVNNRMIAGTIFERPMIEWAARAKPVAPTMWSVACSRVQRL